MWVVPRIATVWVSALEDCCDLGGYTPSQDYCCKHNADLNVEANWYKRPDEEDHREFGENDSWYVQKTRSIESLLYALEGHENASNWKANSDIFILFLPDVGQCCPTLSKPISRSNQHCRCLCSTKDLKSRLKLLICENNLSFTLTKAGNAR